MKREFAFYFACIVGGFIMANPKLSSEVDPTGQIQRTIDAATSNVATLQSQVATLQSQVATLQSQIATRLVEVQYAGGIDTTGNMDPPNSTSRLIALFSATAGWTVNAVWLDDQTGSIPTDVSSNFSTTVVIDPNAMIQGIYQNGSADYTTVGMRLLVELVGT